MIAQQREPVDGERDSIDGGSGNDQVFVDRGEDFFSGGPGTDRFFDELQQQFCWRLCDAAGNVVALTLPWAGVNEGAIEFLEAVNPARDELTGVVAQC